MTDAVAIANIALNNLGDKTISDFSDNTAQAFATKTRFSDVVNQVLRAHPWNCATKRATLAKFTVKPVYNFDHAYQLPTDALRVVSLYEEINYDYAWKIELIADGEEDRLALVTSSSTANITYIKKYIGSGNHDNKEAVMTLNNFDPILVQAVGMALAGEIAMDLTGQSQLRDLMLGKYQAILSEARSINGQEGTADRIESNEWINARTRSASGYFKPFSADTANGVTA